MLSGECRIEGIPLSGQAVLLDGLRLRLDLRLRVTPKQAAQTQHLRLSPAVQRGAALAGLSALIAALAVWSWSGPAERESSLPAPMAAPALTAPAAVPALTAPAAAPALTAPAVAPALTAPAAAPALTAPAALPNVRVARAEAPTALPPSAVAPGVAPPAAVAQDIAALRAAPVAHPQPLPPPAPRARALGAGGAVPASVSDSDLLYLFGDTK